jgi:hypothetical protein
MTPTVSVVCRVVRRVIETVRRSEKQEVAVGDQHNTSFLVIALEKSTFFNKQSYVVAGWSGEFFPSKS